MVTTDEIIRQHTGAVDNRASSDKHRGGLGRSSDEPCAGGSQADKRVTACPKAVENVAYIRQAAIVVVILEGVPSRTQRS